MRLRLAFCLLVAFGVVWLLPACHRAPPAELVVSSQSGTESPLPVPVRSSLYSPTVTVQGQGRLADSLVDRIRADLPVGWRGMFVVEEGCADEDCLYWWMASADGSQRVIELPRETINVVVPEAGTQHMDPVIVKRYVQSLGRRLYPSAGVIEARYAALASRTSNDDITLVLGETRNGVPYRIEIHASMWVSTDAGPSSAQADQRTATLRTTIHSAPADVFNRDGLRNGVELSVRLEQEGWDFEAEECVRKARWIQFAAYIGADEDSRQAEAACRREWETRKQLRDQSMSGIGASFWRDDAPTRAVGRKVEEAARGCGE